MNDWPVITILIVTYDRPCEIERTIRELYSHLRYPGYVGWHIADDGTGGTYIADIVRDMQNLGIPQANITHTITNRQGWGANVNKALQSISSDYIFLNEDDYVPFREIDLAQGVALLETEQSLGLVRYDGIEGHALTLHLTECKNTRIGTVHYCQISKHSPHLNVYSNRPHLKHRRLHDVLGLYKEGLPLGQTEEHFAHKLKDNEYRDKLPHVAVLADGIIRHYDHIGKSRQGQSDDVHFKRES